MNLRKPALAAALVATLGAGALPAVSSAATTTTTKKTSTYHIAVNKGILAGGADTVTVKAVVSNPQKNVSDWYSRSTIQKVVRAGVNQKIQKPYTSQGYRCTPTLDGSMNASTARFTCKLQGADVPTSVTLTFTVPYAQTAGN
jgi:hypothetical protein